MSFAFRPTALVDLLHSRHQVGIRQRSLRHRCRLGRATELVFVLASGATLLIGGQGSADDLIWTGAESNFWDEVGDENWINTTTGSIPDFFVDGDDVTFDGTAFIRTVTISQGAPVTTGDITFGASSYVIDAATSDDQLDVTGTLSVTNAFDSAIIYARLVDGATIEGAGNLMLAGGSGDIVTTGDIVVNGAATQTVSLRGGTFFNDVVQNGGNVLIDGANFSSASNLVVNSGTMTVASTVTVNDVTLDGPAGTEMEIVSGGALQYDAAGTLDVEGAALLDLREGGTIGTSGVNVSVNAGAGSALSIEGTVNGDVTTASSTSEMGGNVSGRLTVSGGSTTVNSEASADEVLVTGGDLTINDTLNVRGGTGPVVYSGTSTGTINGTVNGSVFTASTTGITLADGGQILGVFGQNSGGTNTTVTGDFSVSGEIQVNSGIFTINGGGDTPTLTTSRLRVMTISQMDLNGELNANLWSEGGTINLAGDIVNTRALEMRPGTAGVVNVTGDSTIDGYADVYGGVLNVQGGTTLTVRGARGVTVSDGVGTDTMNLVGDLVGDLTVNRAGIMNFDGGDVTGNTTVNTGGSAMVSADTTFNGDVTLAGGTAEFDNGADIAIVVQDNPATAGTTEGTLTIGGSFTDTGTAAITSSGAGNVAVSASTLVLGSGFVENDVAVTGGGGFTFDVDALDVNTGGALNLTTFAGTLLDYDVSVSSGTATIDAATVVGDGAGTFFGVTVDSGAALVLDDDLTASSLTSNGNTTFGDGVTFFGMGNTYVNGAGSTDTFGDNAGVVDNGAVTNNGTLEFNGSGFLTADANDDDALTVANSATGTINMNDLDASNDDVLTVAAGGADTAFENQGAINLNGQTLDVTGVTALNTTGAGVVDMGGGTIVGDVVNESTAQQSLSGTIGDGTDGSGSYTQQTAATADTQVVAGDLTVDGAVTINAGSLTVGDGVTGRTISADTVTIGSGGTVNVSAGSTLENTLNGLLSDGDLTNGGVLDVGDGATVQSVGNILNNGTLAFSGSATLDANTDGDFSSEMIRNTGLIQANGGAADTVAIGGDSLTNTGTGRLEINGGTLNGIDTLTNSSSSGSAIQVGVGATLGFNTLNSSAGTVTSAGTLDGDVALSGTAALVQNAGGSVDGNLSTAGASAVDINGTSGDATVEVDGNLTLFAGATGTSTLAGDVAGNVSVSAGTLTVDGASVIGTTLDIDGGTVNADAATTVTGAATVTSGSLTVGAGQSLTYASLTVADGASFTAGTGAQVFGTANTTTINGAATYNDGSALNDNGSIDIGATGSVTFNTGGTGIVFDADQDNNAVGTITSDGTITVNGTGNVSFGTDGDDNFTNQGSATLALLDSSSVSDIDVLTNSSTANGATAGTAAIFLGGGTSLGFTTLNSSAGTIVSAGTLDGDVNLSGTADLDLNDGTITGALDNQSATAITLDGTVTGAFTQQGAGAQTTVDGTSTFGSTVDVDSGTLTVNADTTVTGATTVDDATLNVGAGSTLTASGNVLAGGSGGAGTVVVDGTLDGDVTAENTATVTVNGSVDGNLETRDTASFDINGTSGAAPAEVTGNVTQAGTSALNTLAGDIAGFLQQTGAGTITVDGDAVVSGLVNIDAGTLTVAGGATLDATGAGVDVAAGAFGNVAATGEIDGATTNAGTFQNDGTVDGVTNSGGFTNNGTTGGVGNSGTFTNNGGTGTVSNSGTFDNNGSTLAFTNTGTLTTSGTITGDLDQTAGSTTADGNATVTGELDIDGGTLTVDPGITLSAGSADIEDAGGVTVGAGATLQTTTGALTTDDQVAVGAGGNLIAATTLTNQSNGVITYANGGTLSAGGAGQGTIVNEGQIVIDAGTVTATGNDNLVASGMGTGLQILGGTLDLGTGTVTDTGTGSLTAVTLTADASGGAALTTGGVTFDEAGIELNANVLGDATVNGPVTVGGTGFFDLNSAGGGTATITGDVVQQAGSTATSTLAGTLGGILDINGGTVTVDGTGGGGTSVVTGALTVDDATLNVNADTDAAAGTTVGATGTVSNTATFTTDVANAGGFTNDGTVVGGVGNSGTFDNNGAVTGNVTNTGTLTDSGSIGGTLTQTAGSTTVDGNATVTGLFDMDGGTLAVDPGFTFAVGSADIEDAGGVTLGAGATLQTTSGDLDNDDQVAIGNGGTLLSFAALGNEANGVMDFLGATGALTAGAGSDITNTGRFNINSGVGQTVTLTTSGGGSFTSSGLIDMVDGETADRLVINGDAVLNGVIGMDVNVSGAMVGTSAADTADQVNVTGTATGAPTLAFSNVNGVFSNVAAPIDLITAASTAGVSATQTGLPTNGAFVYNLQNTGTAVQLTATPNLAFGGVASGLAATQSLISTVVNRPSSALVTPLVAPGDDPCAIGSWSRITGGRASASLSTSAASLPGSLSNQIDLRYRGIQIGLDRSCSGGYYNGWDLAYGAMLGTNGGDTSLPVNFGGTVTTLSTEFDQTFGGLYLSAAKGQWFGDLSIRADKTTYSIQESNSFANGGLGIETQDFDSRGKTVSGSLSYSHTLNEQLGLRLVPTAGFSFSHIESDSIAIENDPSTTADNATLQVGDIDQRIGYLGATLARTQVAESGTAATTYFVTGTYFNDFGDDLDSTFTVDSNGSSQVLTSETLAGFGELSFGFNYTAILDAGSALPARQVDASLRADTRFSDNLDSWGLTAQVRLQF